MGNYRFRLRDMIPNAWFYKLKDMNGAKKKQSGTKPVKKKPPSTGSMSQRPQISETRYSYYFTESTKVDNFYTSPVNAKASDTHFPDPPRKSGNNGPKRKTLYRPSPRGLNSNASQTCACQDRVLSTWLTQSPDFFSSLESDPFDDFVIDKLPPISTKAAATKKSQSFLTDKNVKHEFTARGSKPTLPAKKSTAGIKLRANSPRIANRKIQGNGKKGVSSAKNRKISESFVIVKSSVDPARDFRESMVEMIVENNIRGSNDLEELLACYLSLNSREYHDHIIHAFEQIWLDMNDLRLLN